MSKSRNTFHDDARILSAVLDTTVDAIISIDQHGIVESFNKAAECMFGYSADEVIGRNVNMIMPAPYHDEHDGYLRHYLESGERKVIGIGREVMAQKKDGTIFPIKLAVSEVKLDQRRIFTGIIHDLTEQKQLELELERRHSMAARHDRLRSLGEMAAGIAHELNQPLAGVRGLAEHVLIADKRGWQLSAENIREKVRLIVEQADRMTHIIEHVRIFAREAGKPELSATNVNLAVEAALELIGTQLQSHGVVRQVQLDPRLPPIQGNPFSLEEVILNLLNNARDAVELRLAREPRLKSPNLLIRTCTVNSRPARQVRIEIIDRGCGIAPEIQEKIFDPFFTTKAPDRGTGLGLAICKSIVEDFDGALEIQSPAVHPQFEGEGTAVIIAFPACNTSEPKN